MIGYCTLLENRMVTQNSGNTIFLRIIDGPSLLELQAALFLGDNSNRRIPTMRFQTEGGGNDFQREVKIDGVDREDGSGTCWIIDGLASNQAVTKWYRFEGFYRTTDRKGHINVEQCFILQFT